MELILTMFLGSKIMSYRLLLFLFLVLPIVTYSQTDSNNWMPEPAPQYSFVKYYDNVFNKPGVLDPFFSKLSVLRHTGKGKVTIVHIGDSHIQADGPTSVVRCGFQDFFGNAGRGLVFPYQLANSNAPHDIKSISNTTWKSNRLTSSGRPVPTGVCGYGILSSAKNATVNMRLIEADGRQDSFNRMVFFLSGDSINYTITDSGLAAPLHLQSIAGGRYPSLVVNSNTPLKGFSLQKANNEAGDYIFYGVSLERKDKAGVLYHTIGVNGASYGQYLQSKLFWEQVKALQGDLFIISLGTNEAQNQYINEQAFTAVCDSFVKLIHLIAPAAEVLITTPGGSYLKAKKPNAAISKIAACLKGYGDEKHIAVWDLFEICGGMAGIPSWKKQELMSHDLVHYNNAGYRLQGALLLNAFAGEYNLYDKMHPYMAPIVAAPKSQPLPVKNEIVKIDALKVKPVPPTPKAPPAAMPPPKMPLASQPVSVPQQEPQPQQQPQQQPQHKGNIIVKYGE